PKLARSWQGHGRAVHSVAFSSGTGPSVLYTSGGDGLIKRWAAGGAWPATASFRARGRLAVGPGWLACTDGGSTHVLDGPALARRGGGPLPVGGDVVAVSPGGEALALGAGKALRLVARATGRVVRELRAVPENEDAHDGRVSALAFSPDGALLLSSSEQGKR